MFSWQYNLMPAKVEIPVRRCFLRMIQVCKIALLAVLQGSKGNIVVELGNENEQIESAETMFKMDEELSGLKDALEDVAANQSISQNRSYHRDFYSDTEVDATSTPQNSRPSTPIQSDSEYELSKVQEAKVCDPRRVYISITALLR